MLPVGYLCTVCSIYLRRPSAYESEIAAKVFQTPHFCTLSHTPRAQLETLPLHSPSVGNEEMHLSPGLTEIWATKGGCFYAAFPLAYDVERKCDLALNSKTSSSSK